jgi:hypothetical protein
MNGPSSPASGWRLLLSSGLLFLLAGALVVGALWLSATDRALAPSPPPDAHVGNDLVADLVHPDGPCPFSDAHCPRDTIAGPVAHPGTDTHAPVGAVPDLHASHGLAPVPGSGRDTLYNLAWRAGTSPLLIQQANCLVGQP